MRKVQPSKNAGMGFSDRFVDKVLFVTGGASGIGLATAQRVVSEGGRAAIVDLDLERAQQAAATLPGCIGLAANVADEAAVAAAVKATCVHFGGIDLVLAAAGHAEFGPVAEWDAARFSRMIEVHLGGTFHVCKHTLPVMKARGSGSIVTIASTAAFTANPKNAPYGAAKAGIAGLTRQLSLEALPEVRVNCVAPGRTITGMTTPLMLQRGGDMAEGERIFSSVVPMRRMGSPAELAGVICFFLSDDASFVTGQTLLADGGETIV
jgi:NAD(P)-dependent dehydrogenase (short-subunit alcohol dehydrogenase family)